MDRDEPCESVRDGPGVPIAIEVGGVIRRSLKAAAEARGLPYERVRWRYHTKGWTLAQALEMAPMPKRYVRRRSWKRPEAVETWTSPRVEQETLLRVEEMPLSDNLAIPQVETSYREPVNSRAPTSRCIPVTVEGVHFRSRMAAARYYRVDPMVFNARLKEGWSPEEAAGLVRRAGSSTPINVTVADKTFRSLKAAAEAHRLSYMTVYQRHAKRGWTLEQALGLAPPPGGRSPVDEVAREIGR